MKDLIAKLEAATEGSRELDLEIWNGIERQPLVDGENGATVANYTASIDAALTLAPEGWDFDVSSMEGKSSAHVSRPVAFNKWFSNLGQGGTPALSICIAALKARAS